MAQCDIDAEKCQDHRSANRLSWCSKHCIYSGTLRASTIRPSLWLAFLHHHQSLHVEWFPPSLRSSPFISFKAHCNRPTTSGYLALPTPSKLVSLCWTLDHTAVEKSLPELQITGWKELHRSCDDHTFITCSYIQLVIFWLSSLFNLDFAMLWYFLFPPHS